MTNSYVLFMGKLNNAIRILEQLCENGNGVRASQKTVVASISSKGIWKKKMLPLAHLCLLTLNERDY